jgi:hypothetical protein
MSFDVIKTTLASAVADDATFAVDYPTGRTGGSYTGGRGHEAIANGFGPMSVANGLASFSFGASAVTITNLTGQTLPAGTQVLVQLDRVGLDNPSESPNLASDTMAELTTVMINLGSPIASDSDAVVETQAATLADGLATGINGASEGVLDVPRNVVAAWTGTAVLTVTGTDEFGNVVRESSGSGTSFTGKKAFKTVTDVTVSANVTGLTVGTSKVLGLPVFLPATGYVIRELVDGAAATAGTLVAGVTTAATATTGDVRGTYSPNGTPNGTLSWQLVAVLDDPSNIGVVQF